MNSDSPRQSNNRISARGPGSFVKETRDLLIALPPRATPPNSLTKSLRIVISGSKDEGRHPAHEALALHCGNVYQTAKRWTKITKKCQRGWMVLIIAAFICFLINITYHGIPQNLFHLCWEDQPRNGHNFHARLSAAIFPPGISGRNRNMQIRVRDNPNIGAETLVETNFPLSAKNPVFHLGLIVVLLFMSLFCVCARCVLAQAARLAHQTCPEPPH